MGRLDPVTRLSEALIDQSASKLDYLCREYRETKDDLSCFLIEYYEKVGPSLAALHRDARAPRSYREPSSFAVELPGATKEKRDFGLRVDPMILTQTRELYLLLVRKLHPDVEARPEAEETLKHVTHAYHEGLVGRLWKISFEQEWKEIRRLPQGTQQSFLLHYHQLLSDAACVMENSLRGLFNSPEYQLQQRVFSARLRGEDLLSRIVEHLEEEADRQIRRLEFRRMRQQLMEEAVWA